MTFHYIPPVGLLSRQCGALFHKAPCFSSIAGFLLLSESNPSASSHPWRATLTHLGIRYDPKAARRASLCSDVRTLHGLLLVMVRCTEVWGAPLLAPISPSTNWHISKAVVHKDLAIMKAL